MRIFLYHSALIILMSSPVAAAANDYPTQTRVEFVLQCMNKEEGNRYQALYQCVCIIDEIAKEMKHANFIQAQTFTYLKNRSGESGSLFRDPPQAKKLRNNLEEAEKNARSTCIVR